MTPSQHTRGDARQAVVGVACRAHRVTAGAMAGAFTNFLRRRAAVARLPHKQEVAARALVAASIILAGPQPASGCHTGIRAEVLPRNSAEFHPGLVAVFGSAETLRGFANGR